MHAAVQPDATTGYIALGVLVLLYFLPYVISNWRSHPNQGSIFVLNLFLGWTLIFWVICLAWAVCYLPESPPRRPPRESYDVQ